MSSQDLLARLPNEVLLEIIGYVKEFPPCEAHLFFKKDARVTRLVRGARGKLWGYQAQDPPVFNTFQAFASVNKKVYHLSRPYLWNVSTFSSSSVFRFDYY